MKLKFLYFVVAGAMVFTACKKDGCTDATATNYDEKADKDDGSCTYASTTDTTTNGGTTGGTNTGGTNTGGTTDTTTTGGTTDTTNTGGTTDTTTTGGNTVKTYTCTCTLYGNEQAVVYKNVEKSVATDSCDIAALTATALGGSCTLTEGTPVSKGGTSEYWFSDDNIKCTPYSSNPKIGNAGILSVVSNPCQSSSAKLDGYFKYGSRPAPGTYTVIGNGTALATPGTGEFSMIFYQHNYMNWYSVEGTVKVSTNANDASKLDLIWSDVKMMADDSTATTEKFSGSLYGL